MGTNATGTFTLNPAESGDTNTSLKLRDSPATPFDTNTSVDATDGQSPQIKSVKIIDNTTGDSPQPRVEIVYTESVTADVPNYAYHGPSVTDVADSPGATHTLTLSGTAFPPETTGFIDFVVSYTDDDPTQTPTGLMDTAENVLKATDAHPLSMHPVVAGQIPTVISAAFTGPNTILSLIHI